MNTAQRFRLGSLEVDPRSGLVAGPGGCERLDRKVMEVFMMMALRAGEVVSREELLRQLWPNVVVTDEVVTRCIYVLRRHLSQAASDRDYRDMIETLHKRGYRLRGTIKHVQPMDANLARYRTGRRPLRIAIAVSALFAMVMVFAIGAN